MEQVMTQDLLIHYLSGFPKQLFFALIPFFIPLEKKKRWYLYYLALFGLVCGVVALGTVTFPALWGIGVTGQVFFALHYCATLAAYMASLYLMCRISWQEAAYAVVCAYMAEHIKYCVITLLQHFLGSPAWLDAWYINYPLSLVIYGGIYFLFVRKITKDGHYLTSVLRSFNLFVISMALMYFLSVYLIELDLAWIHAVYTLIFIIVLLISEIHSSEQLQLQEEIETKERIWALNKVQYEMSKENIEIINRKSHDLKRQIAALRTVSTPEEQAAAIGEIEQAVQIYDKTFQTGSRALDTVLMQEALKCSQNHIEFTAVANGELLRFIKSVDLYTMLSNVLDNAVEANLRITEESRRAIHLSVHEKKGLIILQCENPYDGSIAMQDGLPLTSKADKTTHGFGTRSIQATAEKYGGVLRVNPDNGMYVLRIIFQSPDTNQDEKTHS